MKHTILPEKPLPGIHLRLTIATISALSLAISSSHLFADGTASYSFQQDNRDASSTPVFYGKTVGPVAVPLSATEMTPNSSYTFDVSGLQKDPTSLATRASLTANVDHQGNVETWSSSEASAVAEASLVDFATVQGPAGATSGTVVFNWVVTGAATLNLDTTDFNIVEVADLSTSAKLESTIPGAMGSLIDVTHKYPKSMSVGEVWQDNQAVDSDALTFDVPWQAGVEMPVFFDLTSSANLDISIIDAAGFKAGLDIDLGNTAVLKGVAIFDDNGAKLDDARLVSRDGFVYPNVPEPSACSLFVIGLIFVRIGSRRR